MAAEQPKEKKADRSADPKRCAVCGKTSPRILESCVGCRRSACNQCLTLLYADRPAAPGRKPGLYCTTCQERHLEEEETFGRPSPF